MRIATRKSFVRLVILFGVLLLLSIACWWTMIRMPGASYSGPLPALTAKQASLASRLQGHVQVLAGDIGSRNLLFRRQYGQAAEYIIDTLATTGLDTSTHTFTYNFANQDRDGINIICELPGASMPEQVIIIGAHYDSCESSPGANDNASGVAAVLELAAMFADRQTAQTVRFIAFANEEPPCFQTDAMGSLAYARNCRDQGEDIIAMLSIESIGCYSTQPGSQQYLTALLAPFYPDAGDFIALIGNLSSRSLLRRAVASFRRNAQFPSQGAAVPGWIEGVGWSDHWSFWQCDYSAVMITDTAVYRDRNYHTPQDTADRLDYERMARVVEGIAAVVVELADQ